mgnify:CR=1 FL=1
MIPTLAELRQALHITGSTKIARRYFVTNGFDGALTMLGLTMGFYAGGGVATPVVISACLGAAIALGVSGMTSAYMSEAAEREKELHELEQALVGNLEASAHARAARLIPLIIAAVNGFAPLFLALLIMLPLWLSEAGVPLPLSVDGFFGTSGCTLYVRLDTSMLAVTSATAPATLDVSLRTVERDWRFARNWLKTRLDAA